MIGVWVYRQFAMAIMSLTTGISEFIFLLLWRTMTESVGCGYWPDADQCTNHAMGRVLVWKNGPHHCDTGVWMVVATDLGREPACGTGSGHGSHPGVGTIGGLVPHALCQIL